MKSIVCITTIFISYIILDLYYDSDLWKMNTMITKQLQFYKFQGEKEFFQTITTFIYIPPVIGVIMMLLHYQTLNSLLYLFNAIFAYVLNGTLKNAYKQARPYFIEESIESYSCSSGFGKPSGHAQGSVVYCVGFLLLFMNSKVAQNQIYLLYYSGKRLFSNQKKRPISHCIIFTLTLVFILLVGISRIFLGVHTFSQVLLGWIYGSFQLYIYLKFIHSRLKKYMKEEFIYKSQDRFKMGALITTILFLILLIINIYLLELDKNDKTTQYPKWLLKVDECRGKPLGYYKQHTSKVLYNSCFLQFTSFSIIVAYFSGCFIGQGSFDEIQFYDSYKNLNLYQKLKRLLLYIPAFLLLPLSFIQFDQIYYTAIFIFIPICLYLGIYMAYIYQQLLFKFNLHINGEYLLPEKLQYELLLDE